MTDSKTPSFLEKAKELAKETAKTMAASGHPKLALSAVAVLVVTGAIELATQFKPLSAEEELNKAFTVAEYDQGADNHPSLSSKYFNDFIDDGKPVFVRNPYYPESVTLLASYDHLTELTEKLDQVDDRMALNVLESVMKYTSDIENGNLTDGSSIRCPGDYFKVGSVREDGCVIMHDFVGTEWLGQRFMARYGLDDSDYHGFVVNHEFLHGSAELYQLVDAVRKHHGQYQAESLNEGVSDTGALISYYQEHGLEKALAMGNALVDLRRTFSGPNDGHTTQGRLLLTMSLLENSPERFENLTPPEVAKEATDINLAFMKFNKWDSLTPEIQSKNMLPIAPYKIVERLDSHEDQSQVTKAAYEIMGLQKFEFMGLSEDEQIDLVIDHIEEIQDLALTSRVEKDGSSKAYTYLQNSLSYEDIEPNVFENALLAHQRSSMENESYAQWSANTFQKNPINEIKPATNNVDLNF